MIFRGIYMKIPYVFKKCNNCGKWLVASTDNFHREKSGKYGLRGECKKCKNKKSKQHHQENRDKVLERKKQFYKDNRCKLREQYKQYYQNNKEKILKRKKQYYEYNRDKILDQQKEHYKANRGKELERVKQYYQSPQGQVAYFNSHHKRRTKEEQQGTGITKEQWLEMMSFFDWKCAYSGEALTKDNRSVDHIIPLNSDGDNMIWNCAPMTRNLNSSKCDKDMLEWYRKQDFYDTKRLDKIYEWQEYAFNKWYKEEK